MAEYLENICVEKKATEELVVKDRSSIFGEKRFGLAPLESNYIKIY